ncbi:short-chain fatty acids transporter [Geothermobacter ehrlichii]|uniref:Short-chain fatty acids transporter n=1 Tax=Geothermobacter ehrlichii TaxID=213224 RepID=A0A5D3WHQ4_9BACT|nr:TIGR00366 family protein [Geothermobacter ehrlichii]TYO95243.1 short-chain fatty acids transporter [Geothermobacter ehrlichii]
MLKKTANFFAKTMERYMPDPFIFAALLTMLVYAMALIFTQTAPVPLVDMWANGLWSLLKFTMQVSITLVFSGAVIRTKPVEAALRSASRLATTPTKAYFLTALLSGIGSLFSWAAGLFVGAFVAKEMAKNIRGCHYPLLVASGYAGFMIWHMGYSSSVGLVVATPGHFLEQLCGIIPTSQTIFAPFNIITALFLLVTIPWIMSRLAPDHEDIQEVDPTIINGYSIDGESVDPSLINEHSTEDIAEGKQPAKLQAKNAAPAGVAVEKWEWTPSDWLEHARIICLALGIGGLIYIVRYYLGGGGLNMNSMNMSLMVLALLLSRTPKEFIHNCVESGKSLGPIVMQFPLYGGIMGMMVKSGLAVVIAGWFVAMSTETTLPFWSFVSGGLINFFVPSGGSQWAVQGPIMLEAAKQMGVDMARVAMAVAWGDQWTNMIQPFWALPLLAIAGMKAKDIMGYCVMALIWGGIVFGLAITFMP